MARESSFSRPIFKRLEAGESMDDQLDAALRQIEERAYSARLREEGVETVLEPAIVFDGKRLRARQA